MEQEGDGMSVLIRGMEMPQKCGQCKLYHAEYPMYCMAVEGHRTVGAPYGMPRPDWCPLVEVKEPHGDLVDKDKLMQEFIDSNLDHLQRDDWKEVIQIASDADVIIKAERNEE